MASVIRERIGRLLLIGINRPARANMLDFNTAELLKTTVKTEFEEDDNIAASVIYGEGGNFCEGWDERDISDSCPVVSTSFIPFVPNTRDMLIFMKPTFAAITGHAFGCGFHLALACDVRISEPDCTFCFTSKAPLPVVEGSIERLAFLVGGSRALELLIGDPLLTAEQAHAYGLVQRAAKTGTALGTAVHMAENLVRSRNYDFVLQSRRSLFGLSSSKQHGSRHFHTSTGVA
uniref:3-hydroxypropionyl-coenzyme A dehydratase n=1 Tax=Schistocephalus solidus TaxID=70667 RepID=A0A0X3P6W0_SCHSO